MIEIACDIVSHKAYSNSSNLYVLQYLRWGLGRDSCVTVSVVYWIACWMLATQITDRA